MTPDALEARIAALRTEVRHAVSGGDPTTARRLRSQLRQMETEWEAMVLGDDEGTVDDPALTSAPAVPVREHVHRALTLLSVPAAPRLILSVHEAFFSGDLLAARLTSLRRDEERSFRAAPFARPYYVCSALTVDLLAPARGLLALNTWPLPHRLVGPLSPRTDLLTAVIRLAEHTTTSEVVQSSARRVLWRLATSIPGVTGTPDALKLETVIEAAANELAVHREADAQQRQEAAERAARQLKDPAAQLFGVRLGVADRRGYEESAG